MAVRTRQIPASETTGDQLLDSLEQGRVIVTFGQQETTRALELRRNGETYYCDTSIKLHTYQNEEELLSYLEKLGIPASGRPPTV